MPPFATLVNVPTAPTVVVAAREAVNVAITIVVVVAATIVVVAVAAMANTVTKPAIKRTLKAFRRFRTKLRDNTAIATMTTAARAVNAVVTTVVATVVVAAKNTEAEVKDKEMAVVEDAPRQQEQPSQWNSNNSNKQPRNRRCNE